MTYSPFSVKKDYEPTLLELTLPFFVQKQVDLDGSVLFYTHLIFRSIVALPVTYKVYL
jgi:hypothetical protein